MRTARWWLAAGLVGAAISAAPAFGSGGAPAGAPLFPGCASPTARMTVVVGRVACQELRSADLGGVTAFSYYLPPACAIPGRRCPTLYLLHGFGGDYTSMLGTATAPAAWVAALTSQPPVPPQSVPDPWDYADPARWVPAAPLDLVLVAPDGRTLPGGYGPAPWLDGFWTDWNPRYAAGGADPRYRTPPPRFASSLVDELIPYVQANLPVGAGRAWRALAGTSLGGYGSYAIGLSHPDMWSSLGAVSGILNILLAPGLDPRPGGAPVGVQPPGPLPYRQLPGAAGAPPLAAVPGPAQDFAAALYAFGDPVADQTYYRGRMPVDLALNGRAFAGATQSLYIRGFSNDTVPRRAADFADPQSYLVAQAFEDLVLPTNLEMQRAFADEGVADTYQLHPGIHEDVYWNPWLREQEVAQYARLRHWDGGGDPPPAPTVFSYRSTDSSFAAWGWSVRVHRPTVEFLELDDVSCAGFTVRGTGTALVAVPVGCSTGLGGSRVVRVDLGPAMPTDPPAGADAAPVYGRTVHVLLHRLR